MLTPGEQIALTIEKPAAGGRMIARHEGQIVLVGGAIPGERVVARLERVERRLAFARVVEVTEPSSDRRDGVADPLCGGCVYSHIAYPRQLTLKADVIRDAFLRIGHIPIPETVTVAGSPERGHRMRARLHVDGGRVGFYREGTHALCDAAPSGQLTEAALAAAVAIVDVLERAGAHAIALELTENVAGDARAMSVEIDRLPDGALEAVGGLIGADGMTGCVLRDRRGARLVAGEPSVADPLAVLTRGRAATGRLQRHPESFFQANRYLVADLVEAVLDAVPAEGDVLDVYAGVGLFSMALAGTGRRGITAVEGDRTSGADLQRNAAGVAGAVTLVLDSVEGFVARDRRRDVPTTIIDPPRTGLSRAALAGLLRIAGPRVIYVSCDPATMARDARQLLDAGFTLASLRAFDLFPNTPHVESLGVFVR